MENLAQLVKTATELANKSSFDSFMRVPTVYQDIFEVVEVDSINGGLDYGMETELIGHTPPREISAGEDHKFDDVGEGWTAFWVNRYWQKGFTVEKSMLRNLTNNPRMVENFIQAQSSQIGTAFAEGRDQLAADVFNRGAITAGDKKVFTGNRPDIPKQDPYPGKIYDNQPFLSTAHPLYRDPTVTFANHSASLPWSQANLRTVLTTLRVTNAVDETNQPVLNEPDTVIYNPAMDFDVRQVLNSTNLPGSANNDANPLQNIVRPIPWRRLNGSTRWAVGSARKGLRFIQRGRGPVPIIDEEKLRGLGVMIFSFVEEYAVFVRQWRYWYGCNFPTS